MTSIYLDPTALVLPAGGEATDVAHLDPGAPDAVRHLVDAGLDVFVLGEPDQGILGELPEGLAHAAALPDHLDSDAWYLTAASHPAFGRPRGGTTVLVGPRRAAGTLPLPRFDLEVRDLAAAAMEILTRQAMG